MHNADSPTFTERERRPSGEVGQGPRRPVDTRSGDQIGTCWPIQPDRRRVTLAGEVVWTRWRSPIRTQGGGAPKARTWNGVWSWCAGSSRQAVWLAWSSLALQRRAADSLSP